MNAKSLLKYTPPLGPVLSLALIGLLLMSALLYYRAIKIQRYLEPALALSMPRNAFSESIKLKFQNEFGPASIRGLKVRSSSILVEKSLLFSQDGALKTPSLPVLRKLARVFLSLLRDNRTRSDISFILISAHFPSGPAGLNAAERKKTQRMVALIQDSLFKAEPELWNTYSAYFSVASQPAYLHDNSVELLEFRIIPSELLHEVLRKLEKYAF